MRLNIHTFKTNDEAELEAELAKLESAETSGKREISDERRALHNENRKLSTEDVIGKLGTELPLTLKHAKIVGTWIWIVFPNKPEASVREKLYDLGFHWNMKRKAWQHPCGAYAGPPKSDPLFRFPVAPVKPTGVPPVGKEEDKPKAKVPRLFRKAVAA